MVSSPAQNGDHRNGHVLVENQQTRLNPDNETHETNEATSKSKVYRAHFEFSSSCYKEDNVART